MRTKSLLVLGMCLAVCLQAVTQTAVWAANGDQTSADPTEYGGAWTNGSVVQKIIGVETDSIALGSSGVQAFGIGDPNAANGYIAGQYLLIPRGQVPNGVLPGGTGNAGFASAKMEQPNGTLNYGYSITGSSTSSINGMAYAASDIYTLSGFYVANGQSYYPSGSTVPLTPYPSPSLSITGVQDNNIQQSASSGVNPSDGVSVSLNYGTSDNVPSAWGNTGILAYWYFNGTYTNAIAGGSLQIPSFGFGPFQPSTYQPGIAASTSGTSSFTTSVPSGASGSGILYVYYVDGIDRYAEASYSVSVTPKPTITISADPTSLQVGSTSTLTVNATNLQSGETVEIAQTDQSAAGTLSGNHLSAQTKLDYSVNLNYTSYSFSPTVKSNSALTYSYTAQVIGPKGAIVSAGPVSVTWTQPTITISANPTSLQVGSSSTLTVNATNLQSGDTVEIAQTDQSAAGTLSGNYLSAQTKLDYSVNQNYTSYSFYPTVTSNSALTYSYTAQVIGPNGAIVSAGPVSVTWTQPAPSVTLSVSPTSSQSAGSSFGLTANVKNLGANDSVTITETSATYQGTFGGSTSQSWSSPGSYPNGYNFNSSVTSTRPQTVTYQARVVDNGKTYQSNTVSATWTQNTTTLPTLTLTTAATAPLYTGQASTLTATLSPGADMPSNSAIYFYDQSSADTLMNGQNSMEGNVGQNPMSIGISDNSAQTVTYEASILYQGQYIHSNTVTVTWTTGPQSAGITITASPTSLVAGNTSQLVATATNISPSDTIEIQQSGASQNTLAGSTTQYVSYTPGIYASSYAFRPTATMSDTTITQPVTATYDATLVNSVGQIVAGPASVNITWTPLGTSSSGSGGSGGTLTLTASPSSVAVGQPSALAASTTYAVGANKAIYIHEISGGTGTTLSGTNVYRGALGQTSANTSATDSQAQTVEYQAALQLANGNYVHSAPVYVQWYPVGQTPPPSPPPLQCTPPPLLPPQPTNQVLSYTWTPNANGSETLTWQDTSWTLRSTTGTDSNGCDTVSYQWVDNPITYTHTYTQSLTKLQITGMFYDPGTPSNPWRPQNTNASQINHDGLTDGSLQYQSTPMPTYGNPNANPAIYVRVNGAFSLRMLWTGSPADLPANGTVTFNEINPDGSTRTWNSSFMLRPATLYAPNPVPTWDPYGNGYPPSASEYVMVETPVPKYATNQNPPTSYAELAKWNLDGNPNTAAHISFSLTTDTTYGWVQFTDENVAQLFGYPTWYYIHEVPAPGAKYTQSVQPSQTYNPNWEFPVP